MPSYAFTGRLNDFAIETHLANMNWWLDPETETPIKRNVGELLMLCVSELAEALEAHRKNLKDSHLPEHKGFDVEIVDTFIRLFDLAGGLNIDLDTIYREKMEYNARRADHKLENRTGENGKKY